MEKEVNLSLTATASDDHGLAGWLVVVMTEGFRPAHREIMCSCPCPMLRSGTTSGTLMVLSIAPLYLFSFFSVLLLVSFASTACRH